MVAGVVSEDVVELDVIDLISGFGSETFLDDVKLLLGHLHAEVVENRSEAREGDESTMALVFVLKVWFNQQATVFYVGAQAHKHCDENLLLFVIEDVLGVQDRRSVEASRQYSRILLECLVSEDIV